MMLRIRKKLASLYPAYVLAIVSIGYVLGELGHYMIGVTSKAIAMDLHYGDIACQLNSTDYYLSELPVVCSDANDSDTCQSLVMEGEPYCEWTYNGLGLDYQILAGPSFIAVFTIVGVFMGYLADKFNRVKMLGICTVIFSIAIIISGAVTEYWHLVVLRMIMAAGESACNPLSTGILSDIFPEKKRALVMSIFNWGIYGGYGIAFPVGRYVPPVNAWGLGWRVCYYGAGIVALIFGFLTMFTLKEPERQSIGEDAAGDNTDAKKITIWTVMAEPRIIMLCLAASIRHCGGMCFAYNCDLYYQIYFPDYDLGWWLFAVTIIIGSIGVVVGGIVSDKFVAKMGIRSRVIILAVSQILATPFAFGSVYCEPVGAMITLGVSYFFAEMWFGILFAILVEIVPLHVRSTTVGVFLFVMNNIGGNLPIAVEPVSKSIGYRESLYIFYVAFYLISSLLFLLTVFLMPGTTPKEPLPTPAKDLSGIDNVVYTNDEVHLPTITSLVRRNGSENSRL
ncbi:cis,cis-muconate transport protein [Anthonomus grandis grandis]|uniref:cis,cis-muconate transport protein n=1 Tax=Anthonomus grandis grandis TaxID=2921223 RepID=UPI0021667FD7|nr:cis,cis-muconate transport protein [Anthonomus grandis grandis]XP_050302203.1 cis,cis-muconate transport protein [Anthonomus grandis grandis]